MHAQPGAIAPDGCPVEVYRRLPEQGEAALVHEAVAAGTTVLDPGAGVGRIAHPLLDLGHPVVAVDFSADMLAHVRRAQTVCASIADLRLDRRFGAVLLASHLINGPDGDRLLATAARHLEAAVHYALDGASWTQHFTARRIDDEALRRMLRGAGLVLDRWLRDDRSWFAARPAGG